MHVKMVLMLLFQVQEQLSNLKAEKDRYQEETYENIQQMRARVHKLQEEKHDLELKLDDERRYSYVLTFFSQPGSIFTSSWLFFFLPHSARIFKMLKLLNF